MSEELAPLCFGAVTYFSSDSSKCISCLWFNACSEKVGLVIKKVSSEIDIDSVMLKHRELKEKKTVPLSRADNGEVKTQLTEKKNKTKLKAAESAALAKSIWGDWFPEKSSHVDVLRSVKEGKNPYLSGLNQVLINGILRRGFLTRTGFETAILKVTKSEARSKMTVGILISAKLIEETEGNLRFCKE